MQACDDIPIVLDVQADYEMLSALDEGTRRRRPVSEPQLSSLPTHLHASSLKVTHLHQVSSDACERTHCEFRRGAL